MARRSLYHPRRPFAEMQAWRDVDGLIASPPRHASQTLEDNS